MHCPKCFNERNESDFLGKETCFKCQYAEKLKNKPKKNQCKECLGPIQSNRWSYCSEVCAKVSLLRQKRSYWTRQVK